MKTNRILVIVLMQFLFINSHAQHEKWRFINIPDYHNAEGLAINTDVRNDRLVEQQKNFVEMYKKHGGELITIPGDAVSGHWYKKKYLKKFRSNPAYAKSTVKEVILESSRFSYQGLWDIIEAAGYSNLLMAVGDHEIGDNPWKMNSEVVKHIPTFRQGFANVFTLDANGKSRFVEPIGTATARPIGTIYEHTSNAYQHKNILFITLDMFRFEGGSKNLGFEGVVSGDISGKHYEWLENVLKEAQNITSIQHIVVQSHLPIIYPVRKYASSGMLVEKKESEKILNLFRTYHVDLYLAGEVHMNTVTKDPKSDLIQFVGRGNNLSNLTTIDVEAEKLTLTTYHQNGDRLGQLTIDKSHKKTKIIGSDYLTPINPKGLQIHWGFDEMLAKSNFKISMEGAFPKEAKAHSLLPKIKNPKVFLNDGEFNYDYSLISENVKVAKGMIGNAVCLNGTSNLFVLPIGPMDAGYERTISCWVKTSNSGRQLIFNNGSFWSKTGQFFNLSLHDGDFELSVRPGSLKMTKQQKVNDGKWHHIAVVLPKDEATINDLKMFVDGLLVQTIESVKPNQKIYTCQANWMSIATQLVNYRTDLKQSMQMKNYEGLLDDFCIWTRALSENEIKNVYENGLKGISALAVEKKF